MTANPFKERKNRENYITLHPVENYIQFRPSHRINYRIVGITLHNGPFNRINYVMQIVYPVDA